MTTEIETINDEEFACLVMRSCGASYYILSALGRDHSTDCGFCRGEMKVAS